MTNRLLIANIGQRDLALDYTGLLNAEAALAAKLQEAEARPKPNLRKWGALLLDTMDKTLPFLHAPILNVALRDLAARNELPEQIVLVGTKQQDKNFQAGDTFRCAEALIPVLRRDHPGLVRVETAVIHGAPNDLNAVLPEYASLCRSLSAEQVYALCTGGTPACNMALSLRAVEFFGEGCTVMHVAENAQQPTHLNIGRYIFRQHRRAALERLAQRGDFDAIAEDEGYPLPVRSLARAAAARLNFNFKESLNILAALNQPGIDDYLNALKKEAQSLANENNRNAAVEEVYWNALLKWRRGECADFLGRVWRLLEGSLQDVTAIFAGYANTPGDFDKVFRKWTSQQPELYRAYVWKKLKRNNPVLPESIDASTPAYLLTLKFFSRQEPYRPNLLFPSPERLKEFTDTAEKLRCLSDVRNASIIAHGFKGLSKNHILNIFKTPGSDGVLLESLATLLRCQGITPGSDPYARFSSALIKLDKEMNYDDPA